MPAFTDANVVGEPKKLGSGACNTVYSVELSKPDGSKFDGVFKPLSKEEMGLVAEATGIPFDNPQIAMRNLATVDCAKALGFDVVPETNVAVLKPSPGEDPQVGLVMERASGKPAKETPSTTLARSDAIREMTKLQLLDHLTGQGDRHNNNYFVDVRPDGSVKVTGIDNDQCFGKNLKDPAGIRWTGTADCVFRGTDLPPVVDTEMATAINKLAPDDLRQMLGDKLSQDEVNASIQRLDGMKKHIAGLESQGRIIEPGGWAAAVKHIDFDNSYAGRAILQALAQEKKQW